MFPGSAVLATRLVRGGGGVEETAGQSEMCLDKVQEVSLLYPDGSGCDRAGA